MMGWELKCYAFFFPRLQWHIDSETTFIFCQRFLCSREAMNDVVNVRRQCAEKMKTDTFILGKKQNNY